MKQIPELKKTKPIVGNILEFRKDSMLFFNEAHEEIGDICKLKSPFRDVTIIFKPEFVKYILQENNKIFQKSFGYDQLQKLLGNGLLTSEGDFWKRQRRLAQPAFHKERLGELVKIMGEVVLERVEKWKEYKKENTTLNITQEMNTLALDMVCKTLFRVGISDEEIKILNESLGIVIEKAASRIRDPFQLPEWVPTSSNKKADQGIINIKSIVERIIRTRMNDSKRYDDLLDMLLHAQDEETGEKMNFEQLLDEVMTIFIAGHETTANGLAFIWYLLITNPQVREKMMKEIHILNKDIPEINDLRNLTYIRSIIDESLRLFPPAWIIGRMAKEDAEIDGYEIKKDCTYALPIYTIQRSEKYWDQPEKFIPERFSDDKAHEIIKYAYFPFGGGPRLCIGQMFAIYEMQICIYTLFKDFNFQLVNNFKFELEPLITLRTKFPIEVEFV